MLGVQGEAKTAGTALPPYDSRLEALAPMHAARSASLSMRTVRRRSSTRWSSPRINISTWCSTARAKDGRSPTRSRTQGYRSSWGLSGPFPATTHDPYDAAFANAAVLHRAGVPIAIMTSDSENERNLPSTLQLPWLTGCRSRKPCAQ